MDYTEKFKNSLKKLKLDGRYRFFNEIERKVGTHPIAFWNNNSSKSKIIVWCSNDYLGMSQNQLVTNSMIKAVENMGTGSGGTRNISGNSSAIVNLEKELANLHSKEKGIVFSGMSPDRHLMEFMELPSNKFHVATQAHPEFKSRFGKPAPLFFGFVKSMI